MSLFSDTDITTAIQILRDEECTYMDEIRMLVHEQTGLEGGLIDALIAEAEAVINEIDDAMVEETKTDSIIARAEEILRREDPMPIPLAEFYARQATKYGC